MCLTDRKPQAKIAYGLNPKLRLSVLGESVLGTAIPCRKCQYPARARRSSEVTSSERPTHATSHPFTRFRSHGHGARSADCKRNHEARHEPNGHGRRPLCLLPVVSITLDVAPPRPNLAIKNRPSSLPMFPPVSVLRRPRAPARLGRPVYRTY